MEKRGPKDRAFELKEREVLRQVADKMQIAVLEFDLERRLLYANPVAWDLTGWDSSIIEAEQRAEDLIAPNQAALVVEALTRLTQGFGPVPMSLQAVRKDGVQMPIEVFADLVRSGDEYVGFVVYAIDMRHRTRIEEKLDAEEAAFRAIVEHSRDGMVIIDDAYRIVYVNDGLLRILGTTRGELLGIDFRETLHLESVDMVTDYYIRRQRGEKPPSSYRARLLRRDGTARVALITATTIVGSDGKTRTVAHIEDLTKTVESEQQLELSRERYRTLVETMEDGLGIDDENGILTYANKALVRMVGYDSPEELVGHPLGDILLGMSDEHLLKVIDKRKKGEKDAYEGQLVHKSGRLIPVVVSAVPLFDPDGKYVGSFGLVTDLTEVKRAEAEARFLLDLLLHDIGNQLQLIVAGAGMWHKESSFDVIEGSKEYILDGANRCIELIQKIRRAEEAKIEPLVPTDLVEVLKAEITLLERQFGIKPNVYGIPHKVMIFADSALSQLLWNLMENGVKHNPRETKQLWIDGHDVDGRFHLAIADNGPGLEGLKKERLFNSERRFGGVGLHLVSRLASKYDVKIKVEDRVKGYPDQGLKITLHFIKAQ
ncbi:MAG: PAS domain S-box protein [Candidatus Thorarchaeota archaeon]|nr:MAG: PAS domain S-box protein [Candidatus Thorarchaeota archaeon]